MPKPMIPIARALIALFCGFCLSAATGCALSRSLPEGYDLEGWWAAVADGDSDAVTAGLDLGVTAAIRRADGLSALQVAVRQGRFAIARALIEAGADAGDSGGQGLAPLFYAIYRDDAGMVRLLIDAGARPDGRNRYGMDPLALALARRDIQVISALAAAEPESAKRVRRWIAAQNVADDPAGDILGLQGLLDFDAARDRPDVLAAEQKLVTAARNDNPAAALALATIYSDRRSQLFDLAKADRIVSNACDGATETQTGFFARRAASGSDPLAGFIYGRILRRSRINPEASQARGSRLIRRSAEAGIIFAQADLGDEYGRYFPDVPEAEIRREKVAWLERAADGGLAKAADNLARIYVDGRWAPRNLDKALHWFDRAGELGGCYVYRQVGYNFQQGYDKFPVDPARAVEWYRKGARCGDSDAMTTLAKAFEAGKLGQAVDLLQAVKYYLPDPDNREKAAALASQGLTRAVQNGDADQVRQWLAMLPQDHPALMDGWLAAIESSNRDMAGRFLAAGVDVNRSQGDETALMRAALFGRSEMAAWLLAHGSRIDRQDAFGGTALSLAAGLGHRDMVQLLLEKGAAPDGAAGAATPMARAVRGGHPEVVRLLLDRGARMPAIGSSEGAALLAFVRRKDDRQMERILLEAQPADPAPGARQAALARLTQRDEAARRKAQWLAGKLVVRRDARGNALAVQDGTWDAAPWRCIGDEMSGLTWLVKDDAGGLHDKDMQFALPDGASGACRPGDCDVMAYRDTARADQLCGASDWRVPTVAELESLAYPHLAAAFPHWPGFVQWARRDTGDDLVLVHASGLLGRTTGVIAFNTAGQVLLVRGRLRPMPAASEPDFALIGIR